MNNEPVMWMYINKKTGITEIIKNKSRVDVPHLKEIPLYTHPVKELTDEEIANTWDDVRKDATLKPSMKDMQDFARAILRKAQE